MQALSKALLLLLCLALPLQGYAGFMPCHMTDAGQSMAMSGQHDGCCHDCADPADVVQDNGCQCDHCSVTAVPMPADSASQAPAAALRVMLTFLVLDSSLETPLRPPTQG